MSATAPIDFDVLAAMIGSDAPAHLREVADLFVRSSGRMLGTLKDAWMRGDIKAARTAAHGWKGAALQAGAVTLAAILARLEASLPNAADAIAEAEAAFADLTAWLAAPAGQV